MKPSTGAISFSVSPPDPVEITSADRRIRRLRPPKLPPDPTRPLGVIVEEERRPPPLGRESVLTVFLAGAECPFTCSFCDLWRQTLDGPTPLGALPRQLESALAELRRQGRKVQRVKLYNAGSFFDPRAVPPRDWPTLAGLLAPFRGVTVECHARLVGPRCRDFANRLAGRLEIAIGLETIHPDALRQLNKKMSLADFDRAARWVRSANLDLRVFVLLGTPGVPPEESVFWAVRSVEYALDRGASVVALIPLRSGNGELERLAARGAFRPPRLAQLEEALRRCLPARRGTVFADLWDVGQFQDCPACAPARVECLRRMNASGRPEPAVRCEACRPPD
jgi:radical SAM enzyme (TIGR01210 family)